MKKVDWQEFLFLLPFLCAWGVLYVHDLKDDLTLERGRVRIIIECRDSLQNRCDSLEMVIEDLKDEIYMIENEK